MVADSGARMALADDGSLAAVREGVATVDAALAGVAGAMAVLDADQLSRAAARTEVVVLDGAPTEGERAYADLRAAEPRPVPPLPDPEKLAVLLYTSGVTGRPRAAMLTHRALLANIDQVARVEPPMIHADDVILAVLPLFHVYGLNAVLGGAVRHAATIALQQRFDAVGTLDLVASPWLHDAAGRSRGVPAVARAARPTRAARRRTPRAVRVGSAGPRGGRGVRGGHRSGGAPGLRPDRGRARRDEHAAQRAREAGFGRRRARRRRAAPRRRARVVLGGEDHGEIEVRGPNLFRGYWPDGDNGPGPDGWWATGDLGFLDEDGDLFLVDRVKELVIVSGFNVYPHEVEDVIRALDGVREAAVIGVPDDETGEAVVAYVVAPGLDPAEAEARVRDACAERLARFKQPARVEVVAALPLSVTGKVQKGRLRGLERRRALELLGEGG